MSDSASRSLLEYLAEVPDPRDSNQSHPSSELLALWQRSRGETREVALAITSLLPEQASAAELPALWRRHWGIDNRLHYVRDVTLGEDACRVRSGGAPQFLAGLRNAVIGLVWAIAAARTPGKPRIISPEILEVVSGQFDIRCQSP